MCCLKIFSWSSYEFVTLFLLFWESFYKAHIHEALLLLLLLLSLCLAHYFSSIKLLLLPSFVFQSHFTVFDIYIFTHIFWDTFSLLSLPALTVPPHTHARTHARTSTKQKCKSTPGSEMNETLNKNHPSSPPSKKNPYCRNNQLLWHAARGIQSIFKIREEKWIKYLESCPHCWFHHNLNMNCYEVIVQNICQLFM